MSIFVVTMNKLIWRRLYAYIERQLDNIDLAVNQGELLALLGQSGSGKSTILRCLTGLIASTSGRALANGNALTDINRDPSLVFQTFAL
jgi:NitT/TauT family transport system ATP-binding protein